MRKYFLIIFSIILFSKANAQDDLLEMLNEESDKIKTYVDATFKGTRLINGHSIETRKKHNLDFLISHRFGEISGGGYQFFGLDQSNVRIGFDYGLTDDFNIGIGRNSYEKTYDSYLKYRLLKQSQGAGAMPISVTLFSSVAVKTLKDVDYEEVMDFTDKMVFTHQVLIARKFSPALSLQVMPSFVHYNAITENQLRNDIFSLGAGGRIKLTKRFSLNAEYYYQFEPLTEETYNSIAIGIDIETGGHVFQLHFTNSQAMIEKGFITETYNNFFDGDIHFGFNISRTFQLGKKK
ncbi:DUF5777 family beta-barrel protein [Chondrinema litorale]|uniref:DUF5777 family beta-barrel protein n=1 Tax=Chondrinema litorale TaxID=2994555 RepID=UPI002543F70E|nr:DUF5777 family beta-barrel protein [Chondrinema litorale]UZR96555.1 DUF5777 family beta-barrel protein [Chondrinema litorale]